MKRAELFVVLLTLLFACAQLSMQQVVVFKKWGMSYDVITMETPTYFFENNYFKCSISLDLSGASALGGSYTFTSSIIKPSNLDHLPQIVSIEQLSLMGVFSLDLSKLKNIDHQGIHFSIRPLFNMNINPYSIRIFSMGGLYTNLKPEFPTSENGVPTIGPWDFYFDIDSIKGEHATFNIVIFAYDQVQSSLGVANLIFYPRMIEIPERKFALTYQHAKVIDPHVTEKPTVTVSPYEVQLNNLPTDRKVVYQLMITEEGPKKYVLDEIRQASFIGGIYYSMVIDSFSLKCSYSYEDTEFKTMFYDETSVLEQDTKTGAIVLYCNQRVSHSKYVLSITTTQESYEICSNGCKIDPTKQINEVIEKFFFTYSFKQNTQLIGSFKNSFISNPGPFQTIPVSQTMQEPLNLIAVYKIDLSSVSINNTIPKTSADQNSMQLSLFYFDENAFNQDPFSLRAFIYNEEKHIFELSSDDVPSLPPKKMIIDLEKLKSKQALVIGLFNYQYSGASIGDLIHVNYPRSNIYGLSSLVTVNIYFKQVFPQFIPYNKKPFYTLNTFTPKPIKGLEDYIILHSFIQKSGNDLVHFGFDEGRLFTIPLNAKFGNGEIKFSDIRCVYLFSDSNFEKFEASEAIPTFKNSYYELDCFEDIRDETFVFMLVAKPFFPIYSFNQLNTSYSINPQNSGIYSVSPMERMSVSFDPNGRASGYYSINMEDCRQFSSFKMFQSDAVLLNVFSLNFENSQSGAVAFVSYERIGSLVNLDPFSIEIGSVDMVTKTFNNLNVKYDSDLGVWKFERFFSKPSKFKFAIFGNLNSIGQFGKTYKVNYPRFLNYSMPREQSLILKFDSIHYPSKALSEFSLVQNNVNSVESKTLPFTILNSFSITSSFRDDINLTRILSIPTSQLSSTYNLNNLECVYKINEKIILGEGTFSKNGNLFEMKCEESLASPQYEWMIVYNPDVTQHNNNNEGTILALSMIVVILFWLVLGLILLVGIVVTKMRRKISSSEEIPLYSINNL